MKTISNLIPENYLKRFRVFPDQTLFQLDWSVLDKKCCPLCFCKLKFPRNKKFAMCNSKKHKKSFIISLIKLNERSSTKK